MKPLEAIKKLPHLLVNCAGDDGGNGYIYIDRKKPNHSAAVVWSNGGGWDHVSVSFSNRTPTWEEMCTVKDMFFEPEETVIQYHPAKSEYVNQHPYCLHLWRPQQGSMPAPPSWMVGLKKGQTYADILRGVDDALRAERMKT